MARKPSPEAPWLPVKYTDPDLFALQALQRGEAQPEQQVRALRFIVEKLCCTYDLSFRPDSSRETDFAEGKRYCGSQIVKLCNLKPETRKPDGRRDGNPGTRDPDRDPGSEQRTDDAK